MGRSTGKRASTSGGAIDTASSAMTRAKTGAPVGQRVPDAGTTRRTAPPSVTATTSSSVRHHDESNEISPSSPPPSSSPSVPRGVSRKAALAFLPDATIAHHWLFRLLLWVVDMFYKPLHGFRHVNWTTQPKTRAILYFTRHSTHNADILATAAMCWEGCGRVARMLLHRMLVSGIPALRYLGGVPGERNSAVALLKEGFWCGVIPGGADEALKGHANCYKTHWPTKRVGFAKVAMEADALLVPFFVRNVEESRFNPFMHAWSLMRGYVVYDWIIAADIPIVSSVVYTLALIVWFSCSFVQLPVPVRCTLIFGDPVPYDTEVDTTDDVVQRSREALQKLIVDNQPNALEGRNYTRALGERWVEWRVACPKLTKRVEAWTPAVVKRWLRHQAYPNLTAKKKA